MFQSVLSTVHTKGSLIDLYMVNGFKYCGVKVEAVDDDSVFVRDASGTGYLIHLSAVSTITVPKGVRV